MRLILSLLLLLAGPALASELRILSAASMQSVLKEIGPEFERASSEPLEAFIRFMRSPRAVEAMKANGMELQ